MRISSATKITCSGSGIPNCLEQFEWEKGQICTRCEDGYAVLTFDKNTPTTNDGKCYKLINVHMITGNNFSGLNTALIPGDAISCALGYKPVGPDCLAVDPATDTQTSVVNCLGYNADKCVLCQKGHELFQYAQNFDNRDLTANPTALRKSSYLQYCVEKADIVRGCDRVSRLQHCESCDLRNGYWAKEVFVDALPETYSVGATEKQSMICYNGDGHQTNLGLFE